jgi:predicted RNA-binding protein YlqC (UPF0109 family)
MFDWSGLVAFILKSYTKYPDAVVVTAHQGRGPRGLLVIEVDERDRGQVIGKGGRNLQALESALLFHIRKSQSRDPSESLPPRIELQG